MNPMWELLKIMDLYAACLFLGSAGPPFGEIPWSFAARRNRHRFSLFLIFFMRFCTPIRKQGWIGNRGFSVGFLSCTGLLLSVLLHRVFTDWGNLACATPVELSGEKCPKPKILKVVCVASREGPCFSS